MSDSIYISGGQRSGKSSFALEKACKMSDSVGILATAEARDEEMSERIRHHKENRDSNIAVYEEAIFISNCHFKEKLIIVDCVTLWLTNIFFHCKENVDESFQLMKNELSNILLKKKTFLWISNEIGMGIIPIEALNRKFCDLQGWANQEIASFSGEQYFMVSGAPLKIR